MNANDDDDDDDNNNNNNNNSSNLLTQVECLDAVEYSPSWVCPQKRDSESRNYTHHTTPHHTTIKGT